MNKQISHLTSVKLNTLATDNLQGFSELKSVPIDFIAQYFEGVKGVKRGGKLILDKGVSNNKKSEINDVFQFMKKGLLYSYTTNKEDFLYSSHEFGIDLDASKVAITQTGRAFESCHYDTPYDAPSEYGSCKASVDTMYIVFTADGQYYGRFYIYETEEDVDIIDGAYINIKHTEFNNKNEPRLSALIYAHENNLERKHLKYNGGFKARYDGGGYANPANGYAFYYNSKQADIVGVDNAYDLHIPDKESKGRCCANCNECYDADEDELYYVERDDNYLCSECVYRCDSCEEAFNGNSDEWFEVNGETYCSHCVSCR